MKSFTNEEKNEMQNISYTFAGNYLIPLEDKLNIKCSKGFEP